MTGPLGSVAVSLVTSGLPADPWNAPETWPQWAELLPHVLAVSTSRYAAADAEQASSLLASAGMYLQTRGEPWRALPLLEQAHALDRERLDQDDPATLSSVARLALTLQAVGHY